jgi:GMP synthase-like glutamine amidotransferase
MRKDVKGDRAMRVVCLQHADYEGPGEIGTWARERGHSFETVIPPLERYPVTGSFEMLVVMGGPMGAYEESSYPWLVSEKRFIADAIAAGCRVFGVCLGSQLVAEALGGRAHAHTVREVGWLTARLTTAGRYSRVFSVLPETFVVGEWHGDTFDLPEGVKSAVATDACENQAFEACGGRVVGLQFHLEWTPETLVDLVARHADWLASAPGESPTVSTAAELLSSLPELARGNELLFRLLDRLEAIA